MIRMIASDVDGTLLQKGETKIRKEVFDVIDELDKRNVLFVVASGRPYCELKHLFEPVMDKIALVCCDGALAVYHGKNLYKMDMDKVRAEKLLRDVEHRKDCEFVVYGEFIAYCKPKSEKYDRKISDAVYNNVSRIDDYWHIGGDDYLKIGIYNEAGINRVEDYFLDKWGKHFNAVYSANEWLEFVAPGVNKSVGIESILRKFDIKKEEAIAFGDSYNDMGMFESVGRGYAMKNGKDKLKEMAYGISERVDLTIKELFRI